MFVEYFIPDEFNEGSKHDMVVQDRMGNAKSLNQALSLSPGRNGFKIEDSFFENPSDSPNYVENEWNPNLGFKEKGGYKTFVY